MHRKSATKELERERKGEMSERVQSMGGAIFERVLLPCLTQRLVRVLTLLRMRLDDVAASRAGIDLQHTAADYVLSAYLTLELVDRSMSLLGRAALVALIREGFHVLIVKNGLIRAVLIGQRVSHDDVVVKSDKVGNRGSSSKSRDMGRSRSRSRSRDRSRWGRGRGRGRERKRGRGTATLGLRLRARLRRRGTSLGTARGSRWSDGRRGRGQRLGQSRRE